MLNLTNMDASHCVLYLENYLDCVENLPDDLQKHISRLRELDVNYQGLLRDVETLAVQYDECVTLKKEDERNRLLRKAQATLISAQELGDEKLQIIQHVQDLIDDKTRLLDSNYRYIDNTLKERENPPSSNSVSGNTSSVNGGNTSTSEVQNQEQSADSVSVLSSSNGNHEQRQSKRIRRARGDSEVQVNGNDNGSSSQQQHHHHGDHVGSTPMPRATATILVNNQKKHNHDNNASTTKNKMRKMNKQGQKLNSQKEDGSRNNSKEKSTDENEATYCSCVRVSFGDMICCDNRRCPIQWYHFSCVSLTHVPKGKWFCPKCRADKPTVMKTKALFLKELERYNREKNEKVKS